MLGEWRRRARIDCATRGTTCCGPWRNAASGSSASGSPMCWAGTSRWPSHPPNWRPCSKRGSSSTARPSTASVASRRATSSHDPMRPPSSCSRGPTRMSRQASSSATSPTWTEHPSPETRDRCCAATWSGPAPPDSRCSVLPRSSSSTSPVPIRPRPRFPWTRPPTSTSPPPTSPPTYASRPSTCSRHCPSRSSTRSTRTARASTRSTCSTPTRWPWPTRS